MFRPPLLDRGYICYPLSIAVCLIAYLLLAGCGGGSSHVTQPDSAWRHVGKVAGVTGSYTPIVVLPDGHVEIYCNFDGATDGPYYRRVGTWSGVGPASIVIPRDAINDMPAGSVDRGWIRTSGVSIGASGRRYALLHIGDGYASSFAYAMAVAISDDGATWRYLGMVTIDGEASTIGGDSSNLVVQEERPTVLDRVTPGNNRYLAWLPNWHGSLTLIYSADGRAWFRWQVDTWPAALAGDGVNFPTVTRTPEGYHLIAADTWPSTRHRWLFSCDGVRWRVVEMAAATVGDKGSNLAWDGAILHALSGGEHYTTSGSGYQCQ